LAATSQTNIGLDKETLTGNFLYKWLPNKAVTNKLELFNIQYIRNKNINRYYDIYTNSYNSLNEIANTYNLDPNNVDADGNLTTTIGPSGFTGADNFAIQVLAEQTDLTINDNEYKTVSSLSERKLRLTENNLIVASSYAYEVDTQENYFDHSFNTFRFKVELAGNLLSSIANLANRDKNENERYEFFNVAYSQYVKTEFNYTKHWDLGNNNVLAMRSFFGIAIPYGNSKTIPFSKSFFAGGPNDNRAWQAYGLGPGDSKSIDDYNEGNFKLALNLEQRFPILGNVKGALFIDAGNIWNFENLSEELDNYFNENTTFRGFQSLENIAIGSGFGFRYDFGFVLLRFDTGFKTYDPSYQEENRWFNDYNFSNAVYNISINYPF
jgi:outer membrane protein assembly factor BamA